tara:strand:+ start:29 stop:172 length:144 start_codon:yes stop_codon:yes gene_type:complete
MGQDLGNTSGYGYRDLVNTTEKCRKHLASNKAYLSKRLKNVENVTKM